MSLSLLAKLEEILNAEFNYDTKKKHEIIDFFSLFKPKDWIYPGVIKRRLNLAIEDAYKILEALKSEGIIESWYEYCCVHCQRTLGTVQYFNELPEYFECDFCGEILNAMENTIKIYRVL